MTNTTGFMDIILGGRSSPVITAGLVYPAISVLVLVVLGVGEVGWKLGARLQQFLLVKVKG